MPTEKRTTVRVTLTIELDAAAWANYQGFADGARFKLQDVREDVRSHVLHHVQGSAFLEEADATVTLAER